MIEYLQLTAQTTQFTMISKTDTLKILTDRNLMALAAKEKLI